MLLLGYLWSTTAVLVCMVLEHSHIISGKYVYVELENSSYTNTQYSITSKVVFPLHVPVSVFGKLAGPHMRLFSHVERYVLRITNVTINRKIHLHEHNSNDTRDDNGRKWYYNTESESGWYRISPLLSK